jgi:hypothetical protein
MPIGPPDDPHFDRLTRELIVQICSMIGVGMVLAFLAGRFL